MSLDYDIQQVCENGHQINPCIRTRPENMKKHCQQCGAPTLTSCPDCNESIPGSQITYERRWADARTGRVTPTPLRAPAVPSYCHNCGRAYPWAESRIRNAIEILVEFGGLGDEEKKTIEQDIKNIAKDVPEAELSARRIKRIVDRCKDLTYEFLLESMSRTAAKIFKEP